MVDLLLNGLLTMGQFVIPRQDRYRYLLATQSSVHTTKFVLVSISLDNFSFYKFCLFIYKL